MNREQTAALFDPRVYDARHFFYYTMIQVWEIQSLSSTVPTRVPKFTPEITTNGTALV